MSIPKIIAGVVFNIALYALPLFVPAGTLRWWRAWVFLAVTVAVMVVAILSILLTCSPNAQKGPSRKDSHCGTEFSRSEEHTSELQSLTNLVCRLLLEKNK